MRRRFSDKQVAARLLKEGRVKYDSKSVSTRIQRIKAVQAQRADFELENGIIEWKLEDVRSPLPPRSADLIATRTSSSSAPMTSPPSKSPTKSNVCVPGASRKPPNGCAA